jgi:hypothetical protein
MSCVVWVLTLFDDALDLPRVGHLLQIAPEHAAVHVAVVVAHALVDGYARDGNAAEVAKDVLVKADVDLAPADSTACSVSGLCAAHCFGSL